MPSKKTRINLTVDDELNTLLDDLSELTGKPKATFILDILNDTKPMLLELRDALNLVKQKKSVTPNLTRLVSEINAQTSVVNNELSEHLNQIDWVENND